MARRHLALDRHESIEHRARVTVQVRVVELAVEVAQRPPDVRGDQVEQLAYGRRVPADSEPGVEEQHGDIGTGQQARQVAAGRQVLLHLRPELGVDRRQLLVERLHLLLAGLELLVGALELLVDAHDLLVGGLELLVAGLQLFDGAPQLGTEPAHLISRDLAVGLAAVRVVRNEVPSFLEADDEVVGGAGPLVDGEAPDDGRSGDRDPHTAARLEVDPALEHGDPPHLRRRPMQRDAHRPADALAGQQHQVASRLAGRLLEERPRVAVVIEDAVVAVDRHGGRRVPFQQDALGELRDRQAAPFR